MKLVNILLAVLYISPSSRIILRAFLFWTRISFFSSLEGVSKYMKSVNYVKNDFENVDAEPLICTYMFGRSLYFIQ